jgi:uncharacterized repeat protein (TIGR02543 family)
MKRNISEMVMFGSLLLLCMAFIGCNTGNGTGDKIYTVTFDADGVVQNPINVEIVSGNSLWDSLPSLSSYTYNFDGWYLDSSYGTEFLATDPVNNNLALFAKWSEKNIAVSGIRLKTRNLNNSDVSGKVIARIGFGEISTLPSVEVGTVENGIMSIGLPLKSALEGHFITVPGGTATVTSINFEIQGEQGLNFEYRAQAQPSRNVSFFFVDTVGTWNGTTLYKGWIFQDSTKQSTTLDDFTESEGYKWIYLID